MFLKIFISILILNLVKCNLNDETESNVLSSNQVGVQVFKELLKTNNGNLVYSPISTQSVLAFLYTSSTKDTKKELSQVLKLNADEKSVAESFSNILSNLNTDYKIKVNIQNKIYPSVKLTLKNEFKDIAMKYFHSDIEQLDFDKRDESAKKINSFVSEKTNGKIKDIISSKDLDNSPSLVLINTVYFEAKWKKQFKKSDEQLEFHVNAKETKQLPQMNLESFVQLEENERLNSQIIKLDYVNTNYSFYVILPNEFDGLKTIEANLDELVNINANGLKKNVQVFMPIFRIESDFKLNDIFKQLGVEQSFTDDATFENLSKEPSKIGQINQKSFIEVTEKGTEASAASSVVLEFVKSGHASYPDPIIFKADHPFYYLLREEYTKTILFIGRFTG